MLEEYEKKLISFSDDLTKAVAKKQHEIFERIKSAESFSFRIESNQMMEIMNSLDKLAQNIKKLAAFEVNSAANSESWQPLRAKMQASFNDLEDHLHQATRIPLRQLFYRFVRIVKNAADLTSKKIEVNMQGENIKIDKSYLHPLNTAIMHILRNACDHGIELPEIRTRIGKSPVGAINIRADNIDNQIIITISDDGQGLDRRKISDKLLSHDWFSAEELKAMTDEEIFKQIFKPGLSTAKQVSEISGRGVGMDVVSKEIKKLGGSISISSQLGLGLTLKIKAPYRPIN